MIKLLSSKKKIDINMCSLFIGIICVQTVDEIVPYYHQADFFKALGSGESGAAVWRPALSLGYVLAC